MKFICNKSGQYVKCTRCVHAKSHKPTSECSDVCPDVYKDGKIFDVKVKCKVVITGK